MIFGNVTTIISQIYADMNRYHDSLNSVREFARFNSVPQNIEARIMEFMITTWQQTKDKSSKKICCLKFDSELHEFLVLY